MTAPHVPEPGEEPRGRGRSLSARDREVLDGITGHENASDPGFVLAMAGRTDPTPDAAGDEEVRARAARRDRTIQIAVVVVVAAALLPTPWVLGGALVAALVLGPAVLAAVALRRGGLPGAAEGQHRRPGAGPGPQDRE